MATRAPGGLHCWAARLGARRAGVLADAAPQVRPGSRGAELAGPRAGGQREKAVPCPVAPASPRTSCGPDGETEARGAGRLQQPQDAAEPARLIFGPCRFGSCSQVCGTLRPPSVPDSKGRTRPREALRAQAARGRFVGSSPLFVA